MLYDTDLSLAKQNGIIRNFLRFDPKEQITEYDDNYILNQMEACNYFNEWLKNKDCPFLEMLRKQHAIAALGNDGERTYKIKGYFCSLETGSNNWDLRDHYAGQTRSDLEAKKIDHPAADLLRIPPKDYDSYQNEDFWQIIFNPETKKVGVKKAVTLTAVVENSGLRYEHQFVFRANKYFYIKHPKGENYCKLAHHVSALMELISENVANRQTENILDVLAAYYQLFIVWMPFAHVNNSLVWGQINTILKASGMSAVPHGMLDQYAMLLSSNTFKHKFIDHVKSHQI